MPHICPLCKNEKGLIIGTDTKRKEYDPEYRSKFEVGEITLDELLEHVKVYIDRTLLCDNVGNNDTFKDESGNVFKLNPPCQNYYGIRGGTIENPDVIVETVTMEDN